MNTNLKNFPYVPRYANGVMVENVEMLQKTVSKIEEWKQDFEVELRELLKKHRGYFAMNPHDEYLGMEQGWIDALDEVLGDSAEPSKEEE